MSTETIKKNAGPLGAGAFGGGSLVYVFEKLPTDTLPGQIMFTVIVLSLVASFTFLQHKSKT